MKFNWAVGIASMCVAIAIRCFAVTIVAMADGRYRMAFIAAVVLVVSVAVAAGLFGGMV